MIVQPTEQSEYLVHSLCWKKMEIALHYMEKYKRGEMMNDGAKSMKQYKTFIMTVSLMNFHGMWILVRYGMNI